MIEIFPKMKSLVPLVRPYLCKTVHTDLFITFGVITDIDKQADKQTYEHTVCEKITTRN